MKNCEPRSGESAQANEVDKAHIVHTLVQHSSQLSLARLRHVSVAFDLGDLPLPLWRHLAAIRFLRSSC